MLSARERQRYDRQIMFKPVGEEGQERLKRARIVVAGAGGLGSPIATYLAAAGIGHLRIVDCDTVDLSNLNRQILHWDADIGRPKAESARAKLIQLNPDIVVEGLVTRIDEHNVRDVVGDAEGIVDAMDNLPTRYLLNRCALEKKIPFFHGAVYGLEGRALTVIPGQTACLRCMYRGPVPAEKFPVIGVAPAVIGSIQAAEVIKYLLGVGELLADRMLVFDGLKSSFTEFKIRRNPDCDHCGGM